MRYSRQLEGALALGLGALLAISISACSEEDLGCKVASDCPSGQICVNRFCVAPQTNDAFSLDPGAKSDTAPKPDSKPGDGVSADTSDIPPAPDLGIDITPPKVLETTPGDGATNVALPFKVAVKFSEPMKKGSFGTQTFIVKDVRGNVIPGDYGFSDDDATVTFTPKAGAELKLAAPYAVLLNTLVKDKSGNGMEKAHTFTFYTVPPPNTDAYAALARKFAPRLHQAVDGKKPELDLPVAVDLDGNWNGLENFDYIRNKAKKVTPVVYWSAVETKSHYFLTYSLYWPYGDRPGDPNSDVPNDAVSAVVMVNKSSGEPELLVTIFQVTANATEYLAFLPAGSVLVSSEANETNIGAAQWFPADGDNRPFDWYVPSGEHYSCFWYSNGSGQYCKLNDALRGAFSGLLLEPGDQADDILKQGSSWSIPAQARYALIPTLGTTWLRRNEVADSQLWESWFDYGSGLPTGRPGTGLNPPAMFVKSLAVSGFAGRPPWAWKWKSAMGEGEQVDLPRGMSFLDPAFFVYWRHVTGRKLGEVQDTFVPATGKGFSLQYCFHPFLGIDERGKDTNCPAL